MSPADAIRHIEEAMKRMGELYGRPLFDEWAVVRLGASKAQVEHYAGPRLAEFLESFTRDFAPLKREASDRSHEPGDFDFARASGGTSFDALLKIAPDAFLFCNNTTLSMEQIRANPAWLKAQVPFANLSERFRLQPVKFA